MHPPPIPITGISIWLAPFPSVAPPPLPHCTNKPASQPTNPLQAVASGLFWYLENTVEKTLKWLYPTAPHRADDWLSQEIYRAACDIGAVEVRAQSGSGNVR